MKKLQSRSPLVYFAVLLWLTCLVSAAHADRSLLSDADLDRVSAAGFEGFDLGLPSINTNLSTPIIFTRDEVEAEVETDVSVYNILTNINTALNLCVLANCLNTGANITNNSDLTNGVDITTQVVPTQVNTNTITAPAQVSSFAPPTAAAQASANLAPQRLRVPAVSVQFQ